MAGISLRVDTQGSIAYIFDAGERRRRGTATDTDREKYGTCLAGYIDN